MGKDFLDEDDIVEEIDIDDSADVDDEPNEEKTGKVSLRKVAKYGLPIAAGLLALGLAGGFIARSFETKAAELQMEEAVDDYLSSEDNDLESRINAALEAYAVENQPTSLTELLDEEGQQDLMDAIFTDMGDMELTDLQKEQLKAALNELFTSDSGLTISGKAIFNEESKAYLSKLISEELAKELTSYAKDGESYQALVDKYGTIEKAISEIIEKEISSANVTYSITDADKENLKQSIISSLGNLQGADGKDGTNGTNGRDGKDGDDGEDGDDGKDGKDGTDGRDGRDGRDGANGADGYTPVKYIDYFTESEINEFVAAVESNVKDYFDTHELDEIAAMTESIKNDVMTEFTETADGLEEYLEATRDELQADYNSKFDALEQKITDIINSVLSGLNKSIEDTAKDADTKISDLSADTDSKISDLSDDTDNKINDLSDSTDSKIADASDSANSRMDSIESDTDQKLADAESNTNSKIADSESNTNSKIDSLKSDTDSQITSLGSSLEEKISNLTDSINEKINSLRDSVAETIASLQSDMDSKFESTSQEILAIDERVDTLEQEQITMELQDNGNGTYTLNITDPSNE